MVQSIIRTVVIYLFIVFALRLMGKRQIGELEASELVVTIIMSEIAALPITDNNTPLFHSIFSIFILMVLEIIISHLAYKNLNFRTLLYGKPSMFYEKGKFNQREMKRQRFNLGDLMEEIRNSGAVSLSQVDYIIMETNGKISVIMNSRNSPVTPENLNLKPEAPNMAYVIIDNGTLVTPNLKRLELSKKWLDQRLKEHNIKRIEDVFYLSYEEGSGKVVLIPKTK